MPRQQVKKLHLLKSVIWHFLKNGEVTRLKYKLDCTNYWVLNLVKFNLKDTDLANYSLKSSQGNSTLMSRIHQCPPSQKSQSLHGMVLGKLGALNSSLLQLLTRRFLNLCPLI